MLFFLYLKEIRYRLFYCLLSLVYSWLICFTFVEELLYCFTYPLIKVSGFQESFTHFIFTNLGDAFFAFFNFSLAIGLLLSFYFFILQALCYIVSSLYQYEKDIVWVILLTSFVSLCISIIFWYIIFLPTLLFFFLGFELTETFLSFNVLFEGKIDEYFSFVLNTLYSVIIAFQFPILLFCLVVFGLLEVHFLVGYRKVIYFCFLILSAFLTPPDVFSQIFFVLPIIFFYEFIVFLIFFFNEYKQTK